MASFVYFYSKFTDEFLLLTAGAMFSLLAYYCYHWAINRRRLGSSPFHVPSGVVKEYLNQLIGEAQFIRTQLFGILSGANANSDPETMNAMFNNILGGRGNAHHSAGAGATGASSFGEDTAGMSPDLMERLTSLESQLAEKEGLIINVNIEKSKLLQDLETVKKSKAAAPASGGKEQDDLLKRLKMLEQQLEEYNMFEDDLANIKRIQQENESLKKKIEEISAYGNSKPVAPAPAPVASEPIIVNEIKAPTLDQASIDALLDGESPVAPGAAPIVGELAAVSEIGIPAPASVPGGSSPDIDLAAFENLTQSVDTSLDASALVDVPAPAPVEAAVAAPTVAAPVEAAPVAAMPAPTPITSAPAAVAAAAKAPEISKSDEELLKEFENLLNSG